MYAGRFFLAVAAALFCSAQARTEPRSLEAPEAEQPPRAYSVGAAYDRVRERLVVFGGYLRGDYVSMTWEWDGATWERHEGPAPSARNGPEMVYDEAGRRIVMFGGNTRADGEFGDTWEYDANGWRHLTDTGPPPRTNHSMAYDSRRGRIVLFGGFAGSRGLDDTWEWDGGRWTRVAEGGPPARGLGAMAYDPRRERTILFGGLRAAVPEAENLGDTWEWDGRNWTRIDVPGPGPRDHMAMAYDPVREFVVLHGGGRLDSAENSETWTYDGRRWTRIETAGPPRMFARMVFDSEERAPLLYGGFVRAGPLNEIWHFQASGWKKSFPQSCSADGSPARR